MELVLATTIGITVFTLALIFGWMLLSWMWLQPKKLEKLLREQGFEGNPYRVLIGDLKEFRKMDDEAKSKPMELSDNIIPRVFPYLQQCVTQYGKNSFIWFGPKPSVTLTDPEQIKEVLNKISDFPKIQPAIFKLLITGVADYNGEKWSKHRRIVNPAFHSEKLKIMTPIFFRSCNDLISKWEEMLGSDGSSEIDVWPFLQNLASDVISRAAFGNSYEEGRRMFTLQNEQAELIGNNAVEFFIPLWRFLPTVTQRRMREIDRDIRSLLTDMITKREKALKAGEATKNDLLGLLLESNHKEIKENQNNKKVGMSLEDIIEECKVFYFAGQVTTSVLLVWSMVLLSRYPDWQERARNEVLQVFGKKKPDFDGLNHLKIVKMILYEVLRLYSPAIALTRTADKDVKIGNITLPAGVDVFLPFILVNHDTELWGDDAKEFNPERFAKGLLKATNDKMSFFPFGWGPRICIGQNFALLEVNMALSLILQRFSFELSPSYAHAPASGLTIYPQYGAPIILHKVDT